MNAPFFASSAIFCLHAAIDALWLNPSHRLNTSTFFAFAAGSAAHAAAASASPAAAGRILFMFMSLFPFV